MNETARKKLTGWIPYVIGTILVVQFFGLGVWQIDRGLEKREQQDAFEAQSGFASWRHGMEVRSFQKLRASGVFDADRQVLLENIIINSRYGYYVITPLVVAEDEPVLLVNRGWIERTGREFDSSAIDLPSARVMVHGRAGSLPRAGYRMGDAIEPQTEWPRRAVYPALEDIASELGREVQPFVLLLDPEDDNGFFRHWVPEEMGPGRHFGYALQWFAMGLVLAGLLVWNYRKRGLES